MQKADTVQTKVAMKAVGECRSRRAGEEMPLGVVPDVDEIIGPDDLRSLKGETVDQTLNNVA